MREFKRKQPVKDLVVDATAARLARALPTQACEPWSHPPAHDTKGCGGMRCSRMFQVKTSKRLPNFCLFKIFLENQCWNMLNLFRGSSNSNTNSGGYRWHVVQRYERGHGFSPLSAGCNFHQRAMCSLLAALRNWLLRGTDSGSKYHSASKSIN